MKSVKKIWVIASLSLVLVIAPTQRSHAIVWVVVQAAMKKVIRAMDLAVQKLQNKTVWLQNTQKSVENTLSKLKLEEISDWTKKNKEQYQKYYEELSKVKGYISSYQRVRSLMEKQVSIVSEYRHAFELFKRDKHFSEKEIMYITKRYTGMMSESVQILDQLLNVIREKDFTMTDGKRLELITSAADRMDIVLSDLRLFNQQNKKLTLQRARDHQEVNVLKKLYGIE